MSQTNSRPAYLRNGLTLIELLVVLTILIALGGIVVSSLPGLLERTQSATAAANVPEIDSAIRRQLVSGNGVVGNRFDSLILGSASRSGEVAGYVGGAQYFQAATLSAADLLALASIGISELVPARETPADATFDSHMQPAIPLDADSKVCSVSKAFAVEFMETIWNLTPDETSRYLVFGLGSRSTLVGGSEFALFPEAPVHFSDNAISNPQKMYSRYLIVVELKSAMEEEVTARFVGVAIPDQRGLRGISQELQDAYSNQNGSGDPPN